MRVVVMGILVAVASSASADLKATLETKKGEVVEGVFRGATEAEVTIEIAGQAIKIPSESVRYVSFEGRLGGAAAPAAGAAPTSGSIEDAFKAFEELRSLTQVGIMRDHYADKMSEILGRVTMFMERDTPNDATREEIHSRFSQAIELYRKPLRPEGLGRTDAERFLNGWRKAPTYWNMAEAHVSRAKDLFEGRP
jgi:hypothetical protein